MAHRNPTHANLWLTSGLVAFGLVPFLFVRQYFEEREQRSRAEEVRGRLKDDGRPGGSEEAEAGTGDEATRPGAARGKQGAPEVGRPFRQRLSGLEKAARQLMDVVGVEEEQLQQLARLAADAEKPNTGPAKDTELTAEQLKNSWPLFRGNALQTGSAVSELPEQLDVLWKFTAKDAFEGTPAIVDGVVYVGAMDENFYALDLKTGAEKWKVKVGPVKAPASVRGGFVYVGDADGTFHCLDAKNGKERWKFASEGEITAGANFAGDNVLFGSGDEHLYCLTAKEGKEVWKFRVAGGPVMGTPAVAGDRTFAAGCDSTLHIIDVAKGKEINSVELPGQVGASAAVAGDLLYVGTMTNQVLAVDWKKGQVVWQYEAAKRQQPFFASAALTDDLVITGSRDKRVHALNRKSGQSAWVFPTEGKVDSSPVVVGKRVFAASLDGKLYVLDLAKGTELKKFDLGSPVPGSPAVGGGCLVIGTEKGVLYCLGAKK